MDTNDPAAIYRLEADRLGRRMPRRSPREPVREAKAPRPAARSRVVVEVKQPEVFRRLLWRGVCKAAMADVLGERGAIARVSADLEIPQPTLWRALRGKKKLRLEAGTLTMLRALMPRRMSDQRWKQMVYGADVLVYEATVEAAIRGYARLPGNAEVVGDDEMRAQPSSRKGRQLLKKFWSDSIQKRHHPTRILLALESIMAPIGLERELRSTIGTRSLSESEEVRIIRLGLRRERLLMGRGPRFGS